MLVAPTHKTSLITPEGEPSLGGVSINVASTPAQPTLPILLRSQLWMRFFLVGVLSSLGYVLIMTMSVDGMGWRPTHGAVLAFMAGTIISYMGNTCWTFESTPTSRNLFRFSMVIAASFIVNIVMAWSLEHLGFHHIVISIAILTTVPVLNYFGHRLWTYAA